MKAIRLNDPVLDTIIAPLAKPGFNVLVDTKQAGRFVPVFDSPQGMLCRGWNYRAAVV